MKNSLITTLASSSLIVLSLSLSLSLSSCKNPADDTTDATVGEAAPIASTSGGTTYTFTPDSTISFVGSKVTASHGGGFKKFAGSFTVLDGNPQGGSFTIDMDSTWADSDKLAQHLKAADFFDVASYPTSEFAVTSFQKESDTAYQVSGNLTLHGVTKNISFPATVKTSDEQITVTAEFDINRNDFGITYEGRKDDLIRDEVIIKFDLKAKASS